jgi:hypothetical protein
MVEGVAERGASDRRENGLGGAAEVRSARLALIAVAALVCSSDLTTKLLDRTSGSFHRRSLVEVMLLLAASIFAVSVVPRIGSRSIAVSFGLLVGAALANGLSIVAFARGVPNPYMLTEDSWLIAFNLADVCAGLGVVLLVPSVIAFVTAHSGELRHPLRFSRR